MDVKRSLFLDIYPCHVAFSMLKNWPKWTKADKSAAVIIPPPLIPSGEKTKFFYSKSHVLFSCALQPSKSGTFYIPSITERKNGLQVKLELPKPLRQSFFFVYSKNFKCQHYSYLSLHAKFHGGFEPVKVEKKLAAFDILSKKSNHFLDKYFVCSQCNKMILRSKRRLFLLYPTFFFDWTQCPIYFLNWSSSSWNVI